MPKEIHYKQIFEKVCKECNYGKSDVLLELREFKKEVKNNAKTISK